MKSINLMKNIGRFTPPEIAKSDLPSKCLYDLPPRNHQVWFTLKMSVRFTPPKSSSPESPSPIYPQNICTIYPPF